MKIYYIPKIQKRNYAYVKYKRKQVDEIMCCTYHMSTMYFKICSLPVSAVASDAPVIRSVNGWSVPAGSTKQSSTEVYLYPGDIVYFDFTYTPSYVSMSFGLLTPSNL